MQLSASGSSRKSSYPCAMSLIHLASGESGGGPKHTDQAWSNAWLGFGWQWRTVSYRTQEVWSLYSQYAHFLSPFPSWCLLFMTSRSTQYYYPLSQWVGFGRRLLQAASVKIIQHPIFNLDGFSIHPVTYHSILVEGAPVEATIYFEARSLSTGDISCVP